MKRVVLNLFSRFPGVSLKALHFSLLLALFPCTGQGATTLSLVNANALLIANQEFPVDLTIEDVTDLYGVAFTLAYDTELVQIVGRTPLLAGQECKIDEGTILNNNYTEDTILRCALQDGSPGSLVYGHTRSGDIAGVDQVEAGVLSKLYFISAQGGDIVLTMNDSTLQNSSSTILAADLLGASFHVYDDDDTDGDGMSDEWETEIFGDLTTGDGIASDQDGDTFPDHEEYQYLLAGTLDRNGDLFDPLMANAPVNNAPVADAGSAQSGQTGDTITLDGSNSSDVDLDTLTYSWSLTRPAGSNASLSDATAVDPSFVIDRSGAYVARLVVNDTIVDSTPNTVTITGLNTPPVADAGTDQSDHHTGDAISLDGSASSDVDPDTTLSYSWSLTRPAGSNAALTEATTVAPGFVIDRPGIYTAQLVVNDGTADSDSADTVTITTINTPPAANAGTDKSGYVGDTINLDGSASSDVDPDTILSYGWSLTRPAGSSAVLTGATTDSPAFVIDKSGTYVAQLIVNDGDVDSVPDTLTITTLNTAPVAHAGFHQNGEVGDTLHLSGSASYDVDDDILTYSWSLSAPAGSGATLVGATTITPYFVCDIPGVYIVQNVVHDGTVASAPDSITVNISTANSAPVADAGSDQSAKVGDIINLDGSASSDTDDDPLSYIWSLTVPDGSSAALSDDTAESPSFDADVVGTYIAELVVHDGVASSAPSTVTITVEEENKGYSILFMIIPIIANAAGK